MAAEISVEWVACSSWLRCLLCCFYRYCRIICYSEGSAEKTSLSSSVEPAHFLRWEMTNTQDVPIICSPAAHNGSLTSFFHLWPPCLSLSGVVSGQLCSDTLGNSEMLRPLVATRNWQSSGQIAATGWVQCVILLLAIPHASYTGTFWNVEEMVFMIKYKVHTFKCRI